MIYITILLLGGASPSTSYIGTHWVTSIVHTTHIPPMFSNPNYINPVFRPTLHHHHHHLSLAHHDHTLSPSQQ